MPATALRHPEIEPASFDAPYDAPAYAPPRRSTVSPGETDVEWREVAPLVERFTGAPSETERKKRRILRKRHRNFVMSGVFLAGTLLFAELVGLVWLGALNLSAVRYADGLDREIANTSRGKSLAESELAVSSSPAQLEKWAGPLGYHAAHLDEFDDVTSNARATVAAKETP